VVGMSALLALMDTPVGYLPPASDYTPWGYRVNPFVLASLPPAPSGTPAQ